MTETANTGISLLPSGGGARLSDDLMAAAANYARASRIDSFAPHRIDIEYMPGVGRWEHDPDSAWIASLDPKTMAMVLLDPKTMAMVSRDMLGLSGFESTCEAELSSEIAEQFDELDEYADETDFPHPTDAAKATAFRLATVAYLQFRRYYAIYPTSEGGVAVQTTIRKGAVILIDCLPEGGVTLFFRIDDEHHRAHYSPQSAGSLPDAFFREAIDKLRREAESRA